jgi:P27 family predicted phage terminase small subunit
MMSLQPPDGLDAAGRAAFARAVRVLELTGEDVNASREPLAAYARAVSDMERLRRRWKTLQHRILTKGSTGQTVVHPLVGAIEKAERWAADCGAALGLDPASRQKMSRRVGAGRPPGGASAPDRAAPARRRLKAVSE